MHLRRYVWTFKYIKMLNIQNPLQHNLSANAIILQYNLCEPSFIVKCIVIVSAPHTTTVSEKKKSCSLDD